MIPRDRPATRGTTQNRNVINIHNRVTLIPAISQGHIIVIALCGSIGQLNIIKK